MEAGAEAGQSENRTLTKRRLPTCTSSGSARFVDSSALASRSASRPPARALLHQPPRLRVGGHEPGRDEQLRQQTVAPSTAMVTCECRSAGCATRTRARTPARPHRRRHAVELAHDGARELLLDLHRVAGPGRGRRLERADLVAAAVGQQQPVVPHQLVRDRHQLAVHLARRSSTAT